MIATPSLDRLWRYMQQKNTDRWTFKAEAAMFFMFLVCMTFNHTLFAADGADEDGVKVKPSSLQLETDKSEQIKEKQRADVDEVDTLPEVSVKGTRIKEESGINRTLPITTITTEQLQRIQPSNIFDAVRSVPGVSISGGPRASGMAFSIRGFSDNDDVMVKVDGAPKGFEKYRMGGTFIEPELLKSIEVQRGPQITSGSGALGGTIIASTKNAADFLKPGQKAGAKAKFGYGNNNDEYSRSYMLYARPDERIDILYNYSNRQSNYITLADGSKLDNSAIESMSQLLKVSVFPVDDVELVSSLVKFDDTGLQPYDATGGQPGSFGNVIRAIDDFSWTQSLIYTPDNPWINFKAIIAGGYTNLHDEIKPGMSAFINSIQTGCNGLTWVADPSQTRRCRGSLNDYYQYKTRTIDLTNTAILYKASNAEVSLLTGFQYNSRDRDVSRFYENRSSFAQNTYPDGVNYSVPPGDRSFKAFYLQPNIQLGQFNIKPGYRRDEYEVNAKGGSRELLDLYSQEHKVKFTEETFSLGLAYDLFPRQSAEQLTIYSNYGQGFRAPLLDEFFAPYLLTPGARCNPAFMSSGSGMCGDLYKPQTSESTEAGISYQNPRFWGSEIYVTSKLNFYHIHTSNLLLSMHYDAAAGKFDQNGWERRNGLEFENFMQYRNLFMRASYSRISGQQFTGSTQVPLYTAPGNALNINIGAEIVKSVDVNVTYRKVSDRYINAGTGLTITRDGIAVQEGYELWSAGAHWQVNPRLGLRVVGENLKNTQYRLDASELGGLGMYAPGRNIKFFVEMMY